VPAITVVHSTAARNFFMMSSHESGDAARNVAPERPPGRRLLQGIISMPEKITATGQSDESTAILILEKNRGSR
jgi:hypothetical protein